MSAPQHVRRLTSGDQGRNETLNMMNTHDEKSNKLSIQVVDDPVELPYQDAPENFLLKSNDTTEDQPYQPYEDKTIKMDDIIIETKPVLAIDLGSKPPKKESPKEEVKVAAVPPKKKFNRADYMFTKKENETLIKEEGKIDGKAFNIRYLENCHVYLYDHSA